MTWIFRMCSHVFQNFTVLITQQNGGFFVWFTYHEIHVICSISIFWKDIFLFLWIDIQLEIISVLHFHPIFLCTWKFLTWILIYSTEMVFRLILIQQIRRLQLLSGNPLHDRAFWLMLTVALIGPTFCTANALPWIIFIHYAIESINW